MSLEEIKDGVHVVECSEYKKLVKESLVYKLMVRSLEKEHPEIFKELSRRFATA